MAKKKQLRDLVVVLPGITGSVLEKQGVAVWAPSAGAAWRALKSFGGSVKSLSLGEDPIDKIKLDDIVRAGLAEGEQELDDLVDKVKLDDSVRATQLVEDAHVVPGLVKIDGYNQIFTEIRRAFEVRDCQPDDESAGNLMPFPYDWRRDNRVAAIRLAEVVKRKLALWGELAQIEQPRVLFVTHSMGGLVARYFLEVMGGWKVCRALITLGTPHRGSVQALEYLANGYQSPLNYLVNLNETLATFTSSYQLLPAFEAVLESGSYHYVHALKGSFGVDTERALAAYQFYKEMREAVVANQAIPEYCEQGYHLVPVVGTKQPTLQSARLDGKILSTFFEPRAGTDENLTDGDGTVPYVSAIPLDQSKNPRGYYLAEKHAALQNNRFVLGDLIARIGQFQVEAAGLSKFQGSELPPSGPDTTPLSVLSPDLAVAGSGVEVRARWADGEDHGPIVGDLIPATGPTEAASEAEAVAVAPMAWTDFPFVPSGDGWRVARLDGMIAGLYRLTVRSADDQDDPRAVHDLIAVAARD
jgi:hypothetical protein